MFRLSTYGDNDNSLSRFCHDDLEVIENEKSIKGLVLVFYLETGERERGNVSFRTTEHSTLAPITNLQDGKVVEALEIVETLWIRTYIK